MINPFDRHDDKGYRDDYRNDLIDEQHGEFKLTQEQDSPKPKLPYENLKCPECQGDMIARNGKYGKFWGCKSFPECKGTRNSEGLSKQDRDKEGKRDFATDRNDREVLRDVVRTSFNRSVK